MSGSFINRSVTVRHGAYLPHWTASGAIYHTIFRLADALPAAVVDRYRREREALLEEAEPDSTDARERLQELFSERIERYLDAGHGTCWLRQPALADLVVLALQYFNHERYELHAWCVMPNHVHAVVRPLGSHDLSKILHTWKSFTAKEANRVLSRDGPFWQKESYDHVVRDDTELERTIRYVRENPMKAGLKSWKWIGPT